MNLDGSLVQVVLSSGKVRAVFCQVRSILFHRVDYLSEFGLEFFFANSLLPPSELATFSGGHDLKFVCNRLFSNYIFLFPFHFNLYLISRTVNNQAGTFKGKSRRLNVSDVSRISQS